MNTRLLGRFLSVATTVAIAALTLAPQPVVPAVSFGHLCLVCGSSGGADIVANVVLFVPLGLALVLAGASWWQAGLAAAVMSTGIETAQYLFVPGRFATLSDVVTNTSGALIGAGIAYGRHTWLAPAPRAAARLTALAALAWLGALAFGAWAMGRDAILGATVAAASPLPFTPGFGWFAGEIAYASVNGTTLGHRGTGPIIFEGRLGTDVRVVASAVGRDPRREVVPLVFLHEPGDSLPRLLVAQYGNAAIFRLQLRGNRLRLRRLGVTVRDAFDSATTREPYTLTATANEDSIALAARDVATGRTRRSVIHLKPTLGWAILSPIPRVDSPLASLATAAWIASLAFPLAYWARWAAPAAGARRRVLIVGAVVAAIVAGLAVIPVLGDYPVASGSEWVSAIAGVVAGALGAGAVRTRVRRAALIAGHPPDVSWPR